MAENENQPREYDAVLGGQSKIPLDAAVLGGIPGVKTRLSSPIVKVRIAALKDALKYLIYLFRRRQSKIFSKITFKLLIFVNV